MWMASEADEADEAPLGCDQASSLRLNAYDWVMVLGEEDEDEDGDEAPRRACGVDREGIQPWKPTCPFDILSCLV